MKDEISKKFYEKYLKQKNNRLPNIIISGVKKCGTKGKTHFSPTCKVNNFSFIFKALLAFLLEHPNITGGRRYRFIAKIYNGLCSDGLDIQFYPNFNLGLTF